MSDVKPEPTPEPTFETNDEVIEDAVVVDEPEVVEPTVTAAPAEPVVVEETIEQEAYVAPTQRVVYVQTPAQPTRKGNRGVGAAIAVASGVVFIALLALVGALLNLGAT